MRRIGFSTNLPTLLLGAPRWVEVSDPGRRVRLASATPGLCIASADVVTCGLYGSGAPDVHHSPA